jgi:hypothetical protein
VKETRKGKRAVLRAQEIPHPGSMADITSGGGAVRTTRPTPRLEGRGVLGGQEKLVLTLVATGRSAGVSVEGRCGSSARRKKTVAWRRGSGGSRHARRWRVQLLHTGGSGLYGEWQSLRRPLIPSHPSPPSFPLFLLRWRCGQGRIRPPPPRRLGLGEPEGLCAWLLIAVGALGHADDQEAAAARRGTPQWRHGRLPGALARRHKRKGKRSSRFRDCRKHDYLVLRYSSVSQVASSSE